MYNKYQLQYFKQRRRFVSALIFFAALFLQHALYQTLPVGAVLTLMGLLVASLFHTWKMMDFYLDCWIEDVMPNSSVFTPEDKKINREWSEYQARRGK